MFGKTSLQFERDFRLRGVNPRSRARHLVIASSAVYAERGGQPPLDARRYLVLPTVWRAAQLAGVPFSLRP